MSLSFLEFKRRVGKNIGYYTDANGWSGTSTDVTEADVGELVNDIYRNELFPLFATQYPQDFTQTGTANSWIANGTANAGLTGDTITTTGSVFTNSMVGLWLYNSTDASTAQITIYNSATSVDVNDTDISDWSGDSVYVLGQKFSFGGDLGDLYTVKSVGFKYNTTNDFYTTSEIRSETDLFRYGNEVGSEAFPRVYLTTLTVGGVLVGGIGILPAYQTKITDAIRITYVKKPTVLSADSDTVRLPVDTPLIYGATARAFEYKKEYDKAAYWSSKFELSKPRAVSQYRPLSVSRGNKMRLPRRFAAITNRYI